MIFVLDFDGTIAPVDTVDALLERFGVGEWDAIEQEWVDGKITSRVCMAKQIDMVAADREALMRTSAASRSIPASWTSSAT